MRLTLKTLRHRHPLRGREHGNTFVFFLLLMPVIIGCFGLGIDTMVAQYTKSTLQADMDAAVQSAISQSNPRAAASTTNTTNVYNAFKKIYAADRAGTNGAQNAPYVLCQGTDTSWSGAGDQITPDNGCGYTVNSLNFQVGTTGYKNTLKITVTEYSKPLFLGILGIDRFTYRLTSTAHLAQAFYDNN